jgi:hypothetical protein
MTIYLLEWPKSRITITPNDGEGFKQQEPSLLSVGTQNGTATLKDSLAVIHQINLILAYDSAIFFLGMYVMC